jgi:hypothetical protein
MIPVEKHPRIDRPDNIAGGIPDRGGGYYGHPRRLIGLGAALGFGCGFECHECAFFKIAALDPKPLRTQYGKAACDLFHCEQHSNRIVSQDAHGVVLRLKCCD